MNKQIKKTAAALGLVLILSLMVGVLAVGCEQSLHKDIPIERQIDVLFGAAIMVFAGLTASFLIVYIVKKFANIISDD
jgi:hypothetical protein